MSSRPSSQAAVGDEGTTSLRSSTARRPVTKPVAPRLSSTGTAAKPTSPSSARTSTAATSTLHKPPSRPTTTSTVRRPPSSTATATNSLHRSRPSAASTDASADESNRHGISARPKRMSLASTTATDKPSTTASRTSTTTPARRTPSTATSSTVRQPARSPTSVTKTPSAPASRTASTLTSRTRPAASSTTRPVTTLADKKRLSTIPASPAVKSVVPRKDDNKENEAGSDSEALPVRPALGTRQSTRSVLIEQRIHEFELVNQMLRSAMTADGMDADEEEHVEEESKNTMARLRSDLAKVRAFEKENGRLPTEAELADMEDVPVEDEVINSDKTNGDAAASPEIAGLKQDLEESQAQVQELKSHLTEITARMEYFSKTAEDESAKVEEAAQSLRAEHEAKVAHMLDVHNSHMQDLETAHQKQMEDTVTEMQRQVDEAQTNKSEGEELAKEQEAHANTRGLLESVNNELESVRKAKEQNDEQHSKSTRDLSEQLAALEISKDEAATNAEASVSKLKTDHEGKVKALETKLKDAEKELQANVDISEHHYTEAMQKLKDDLETSQKQLTSTISERDGTIQEYESKLEAAKEAAVLAEKAHEEEISGLKSRLSLMTGSAESETTKHLEELNALQSLLESKDEEMKGLQASQDDRLSKFRTEINTASKATIESLKESHTAEMSRTEAEAKAVLHELEELKATNSTKTDRIRAEANAAKRAALEEQASTHQSVISELENKLATAQRSLDDAKKSHEEELDQLKTSHQQGSEEFVTRSKTAEDTIEKMTTSHAEESRKFESKVRDMASELDAAKFQTQSLKDILRDMEKEFKVKEEAIQKELESKTEEFSQAVVKLSAQSMQIIELEAAHKQAVEQAKAAVQAETQTSLDALKQEHDTAFDELKRDLEASHQNTLQTMHSEHSHAIEMLTKEVDVRDHGVESMKAEHAQALADLHSSSKQAIAAALEQLSLEHKTNIEDLENKHAAKTAEDSKQSKDILDQTKAEYENRIATHQSEVGQLREKMADSSEVDSLNTKLSASQQAFTKIQEEHAMEMSNISKEHAQQLGALEEKLKAFEAEANKPIDTSELDGVRSDLAEERAKTTELTRSHAEALGSKDREHASTVETLRSELADAQAAAASAARESEDVETVKSLLADAQRTVQELSEQYAVASMDAEHQRLTAESAKKELSDLKKSLSEAAVAPAPSTESNESARAINGTSNDTKPSPKGGLKASKWAAAEPEPASTTDDQEGPAAEPAKPKSRNVAGQAAGIQEQIRQMKEINDEALSDHQKWARTLSRVDDDGTVTLPDVKSNEHQDGTGENVETVTEATT